MENEVVKKKRIINSGLLKLSMCCGSAVRISNTINNIPCYYCVNCGKLTGVVDENGNRVN